MAFPEGAPIRERVDYIATRALSLASEHTDPSEVGELDYVAFFPKNPEDYDSLVGALEAIGEIEPNAPWGTLYHLVEKPIETPHGKLHLVRVREYKNDRPGLVGYVDLSLKVPYSVFSARHLEDGHFKEVPYDPHGNMLELRDSKFDVMAYFPDVPLSHDLGLK